MTAAEEGHEVDQLRVVAQARLEVAVGEGRLTLEEYSDKVAVVWSPTADRGQLAQIVPYSADRAVQRGSAGRGVAAAVDYRGCLR